MSDEPLLIITLKGPEVEAQRVPVDYLIRVLNRVQVCVKRLGQELSGEKSTAGSGRFKGPVEAACRLDVVAITAGSFAIGVDVPLTVATDQGLVPPGELLGHRAVETLVEGLESLSLPSPVLLGEFGYGVLVALKDLGRILERGVSVIEFDLRDQRKPARRAMFDLLVRDQILKHIKAPIVSVAKVRGSLREVNLQQRSCQVFPRHGKPVDCTFEDALEPTIRGALGYYVAATGEAKRLNETGPIQEMRLQGVEVLNQPQSTHQIPSKPMSAADLLQSLRESGVVGMWKDRDDIGDSSEFAEQLRRRLPDRLEE